MKTAMQELLEWVRATLPMDLDTPMLIEEKIKSLLEKEKEQIENAYDKGQESEWHKSMGLMGDHYYNETFNTK
jgi:hypothetical protein